MPFGQTSPGPTTVVHINNGGKWDRHGSFVNTLCYRRDEPVPLRLLRGPGARMHLQQRHGQPLPEAHFGAAAEPHRPSAAHIEVPRVEYEKLSDDRLGESSAAIRARVEAARALQAARFEGTRMLANAIPLPPQRRGRERCGTSAGWTMPARAS
jgi:hypothetical protein